jgi:photosystem II stability/assembly factor-like uncharacterized protein
MKTKLSHILGVSLAVMLVFGLAFALVPTKEAEAQAWTANQWSAINIPGVANNIRLAADCDFIAVGNDGATFYAVDNQGNLLYKSTNAGLTWVNVTPAVPAFAFDLLGLAVAPDDVNCVAVADANSVVYISTNGAATWSTLPALNTVAGFVTGTTVQDIAVSPATLAGREWMVCTGNAGDALSDGNVFIFGTVVAPLAWSEYGGSTGFGGVDPLGQDFISCAFSPNYGNDSTILVVGADNVATANDNSAVGDTWLNIKNIGFAGWNAAVAQGFVLWPVAFDTATADSPGESEITGAGIALPADFDPTNANWRRAYGYYDTGVAGFFPDAYRFDDFTCRELNVNNGVAIRLASMDYAGTLSSGTLFVGDRAGFYTVGTQVRNCSDPWVALPTWNLTPKGPTGNTAGNVADTQVAVAPDFLSSGLVYAGTSGAAANDQSAFSRSTNGGVSWNQISLIDTNILSVQDIAPAADGATFFMATAGNDAAGGYSDSLWRTTSTPLALLWERVFTDNFCNSGLVRLDPDYLDTGVLYFAEIAAAGNNKLKQSADCGEIWANRFFPAVVTDFAVEDASTLYALIGLTTRKSTNGGWGGSWGLPIATGLGACATVLVAPNGDVLVGGGGNVAYSTDGGGTYNLLPGAIGAAGGLIQVAVDANYDTNSTVYAASSTAGEGIYRWVIGTDAAWENILPAAQVGTAVMTGLVQWNGYLYGSENLTAAGSAAERIMAPFLQVTDMLLGWTTLNVGAGAATFNRAPSALKACDNGGGGTLLFAINTTPAAQVMVYDDSMANAVITVSVSPDPVTADPNTGRSNDFIVSWTQPGNATQYYLNIWTSETGFDVAYQATVPPATFTPAAAGAPSHEVPTGSLASGREFWVSVIAVQQAPGDGNLSPWSARVPFTVEYSSPIEAPYAGPVLLGPNPGDTDVAPDVGFSWGPIVGATEYSFILAKDAALTDVVISETVATTAYGPVTLDYSTDYWYAVQATAPTTSPQSIGSFTTMDEPVEKYTCQYCGLTFDTREELEAHIAAVHAPTTPLYIWIVIAIGAILVIAVIWLIFTTRRA